MLGEQTNTQHHWYEHTILGHAHFATGDLDQAQVDYERALAARSRLLHVRRVYDTIAGLARVSQARGDLVQALSYVEEILEHLETGSLDGTIEPCRIYLTCYKVLAASQDPRAEGVLIEAYNQIQDRAGNIADEGQRRSFLEDATFNRQIINEYEQLQRLRKPGG